MPNIREGLQNFNPWWTQEFKLKFKERNLYTKLQKFLPLPQIIALTGLRRVGKTTLMYKYVDDAIKNGFPSRNIVYFLFDEFKGIEIRDIIREYEITAEKDLRKEKFILLLDEIQKLNEWENQLKSIYDMYKENIKIIISGSESLFIRKKTKETLAGRIFEFKLEPLSFKEFLSFKEVNFKPLGIYERELKKLFNDFILTQGFPELVDIKEKEIISKYIKEGIIEKIIYKDIPELFKVKDISVIASLLNLITEEPGQLIEISDLANQLKISRQTLSNYLIYLEDSFLIKKLYNFSRNRRKVERKLKKYYPSIISVDILFKEDDFFKSKIFECFIVNQLNAEFFWRDPYKNEVDIIMTKNKGIMPIEIKYGKIDFKGILAFMKKFKVDNGYILSSEKEEIKKFNEKIISIIPAFKFLLKKE
ncbi:ATP-binding protein [Candidatus Woesearchaeota archaeon]|nr:ATP-binding protein [Candidatus Woesearchaeota archaeon]